MADIIGRIGGTYKHPVVDEIPGELRPEEVVYVKGSGLWIGASENTFPGLEQGTPWPLKGYKEAIFVARTTSFVKNEIGLNYTVDDEDVVVTNLPSDGGGVPGSVRNIQLHQASTNEFDTPPFFLHKQSETNVAVTIRLFDDNLVEANWTSIKDNITVRNMLGFTIRVFPEAADT